MQRSMSVQRQVGCDARLSRSDSGQTLTSWVVLIWSKCANSWLREGNTLHRSNVITMLQHFWVVVTDGVRLSLLLNTTSSITDCRNQRRLSDCSSIRRWLCLANSADSSLVNLTISISSLLRRYAIPKAGKAKHAPIPCPSCLWIRFTQRKRIEIPLLVEIGQRVIDESMSRFIRSYSFDDIEQLRILR